MIRVLIVDDEILVRIGLKTIIPWEENGFELIGEASNGMEALNILKEQPCDIVLTDIRMPGYDGLQLIEQINEISPHTKSLILSNHNDFDYVQKALRLGAVDYILKLTMEPADLLKKLNEMKQTIELETEKTLEDSRLQYKMRKYGKEAKEKWLRELLVKQKGSAKEVKEVVREFDMRPFAAPIYVVNFKLDRYQEVLEENKFRSEHLLSYTVANIFNEIFKKYSEGELLEIGNGKFSMITDHYKEEMLVEIQDAVDTFLKLSVSIGVSAPFEDIVEVRTAFEQADEALSCRFYEGPGSLVFFEHIQYAPAGDIPEPLSDVQWEKLLEIRDENGLLQLLDEWYRSILDGPKYRPEYQREVWVHLIHIMDGFARRLGGDLYSVPLYNEIYPFHAVRNLETMNEIYVWCRGWLPVYLDYIRQLSNKQYRPEIQAVLDMIKKRYNQHVKVSELAKEVGFTENYLSVLFKKETGETIMDYLTRIRMDKARELLKDPAYKIYEISEMAGYGDSNYFSKQFKKMEGVYPLEFRKLYLGK